MSVNRRVLLTVSGVIPRDLDEAVASGSRPRVDYVEIARSVDADLLDYDRVARDSSRLGTWVGRLIGANAAMAWRCFQLRREYDVVLTDGEQVGLPFAALAGLVRRADCARHVMITHRLSVRKKVVFFRLFRTARRIDEMIVYASSQKRFIVEQLGYSAGQVTLAPFMVDSAFFSPHRVAGDTARLQVCSAGLEFRDYHTLVAAAAELDIDVVIAAASPWSKRRNELVGVSLPANVRVVQLDLYQLRQLYADSRVVVLPLEPVDFQAGVTTLLEAMSMGRPVICSRTDGQTDVIDEGVTGRYVEVRDVEALRDTITELLSAPGEVERLGAAARDWVIRAADIDVYVGLVRERIEHHLHNPST